MPSLPAPAEIVPELLMAPEKVETLLTKMPSCPAEIVPKLKMPPPALAESNCVTLVTLMPWPWVAAIVPELVMPPKKLVT